VSRGTIFALDLREKAIAFSIEGTVGAIMIGGELSLDRGIFFVAKLVRILGIRNFFARLRT